MDTPSPLCRLCRQILEDKGMKVLQQGAEAETWVQDHYLTYQSLTDAVQSKCYICTIFWDFCLSQKTTTEVNGSKGTNYYLWREEYEE